MHKIHWPTLYNRMSPKLPFACVVLAVSASGAYAQQPVIKPAGQNLNALPFSTVQMATVTSNNPSAQFSVQLTGEGAYSGGSIGVSGGVIYYTVSPSWSWRQQIGAAHDPALANIISYTVCDNGSGLCTPTAQTLTIHPQSDCGSGLADSSFVINHAPLGSATFYDNFYSDSKPLIANAQSKPAGMKWFPHTPYYGDFGYNSWGNPGDAINPYSIIPGQGLRIRAQKDQNGNWVAGGISSQFPDGSGFALQHGYVEFRARIPTTPSTWPGLWLNTYSPNGGQPPSTVGIELDLAEMYTQWPTVWNQTTQTWPSGSNNPNQHRWWTMQNTNSPNPGIANSSAPIDNALHVYGVLITPQWITYYFDNTEINRISTPPELSAPMFIMPDLVMGGAGQDISLATSPSDMIVNYVRAYPLPSGSYCTLH